MKKHAFTLVELLVVTIIIGILGSIALPQFLVTQERALDNEARATLRMIRAAERTLRMETTVYQALAAIANINTTLRLDIPAGATRSWNYLTTATAGTDCCAQATRNGGDGRTFRLRIAGAAVDADPVAGGTCP
jgi:prepilin-type N-terminal cleavage/methylation domain-containing protein